MKETIHILDRLARPTICVAGHRLPAFQICGYTGVLVATVLAFALAGHARLSYLIVGGIGLAAMLTFLALVELTKLITGEEQLVYYHLEIAVMLMTALVVNAFHRPVLPYLDLTILGIGAFLACGRIGCLMVGCCHGRPFSWGIRYREEHARDGFASYLVGVTLFPVQALESLWVAAVVIVGSVMMWRGQQPGSALAWYTVTYGAARYSLEFIRGDVGRPYTWGFSQAQWLSLWLIGSLVGAEWSGRMPFHAWHAAFAIVLVLTMAAVAVQRSLDRSQRFRTLHPCHMREVAAAIRQEGRKRDSVDLVQTSLGIQLSCGVARNSGGDVVHYTLSRSALCLDRTTAQLLAGLILRLKGKPGAGRLVQGNFGAFHLLLSVDGGNGKRSCVN